MSINHLIDFTGLNLNIGAIKFEATDSIYKNTSKALVSVKSALAISPTVRNLVYGCVTNKSAGSNGTIANQFFWEWDADFNSGRCRVTLSPMQPYAFINANPQIMVSSLNASGVDDATLGGFCMGYQIIDSFSVDIFMASNAPQNHEFCIVIIF